ncbi:MAG: serine dehydratase [Acidobacteria bacterium]|nr:serine dehydratase [Acidobacteriota bacterium]NIM62438.1 serine dehydratase [Acidobacteriota bacterium]NIO59869.1 serine dehydratase [Acidobacteriota bacterium]NIQ30951.1 serine dehydratase [Acidobacteriota bacterium]NIQ86032.1 serine dehydratase [Acidobacteriota bacterium]
MPSPSIFNDVLGPVMRGPSSSHSAAALRIGRLARALMKDRIQRVVVDYDPSGTLVTTHRTQGSDLGLAGGLLGWEADDERLGNYEAELERGGIEVEVRYLDYGAGHPNTYRLELDDGERKRSLTAVSTGGGMIEVREIDGIPVDLHGDLHELFIVGEDVDASAIESLARTDGVVAVEELGGAKNGWHLRRSARWTPEETNQFARFDVHVLPPVMPVLAGDPERLPFRNASEFLECHARQPAPLWQWALRYESARSGWAEDQVLEQAKTILHTMRYSLDRGLEGREIKDSLLPTQVKAFERAERDKRLVEGDIQNRMVRYVTAIMESKAGNEVIVAAPTAGSCAALPGALLAVGDGHACDEETVVRALLAAGLIGVFITEGATFSAELGGCMAECGSASGMAAAGITEMMGGSPESALSASSVALQNMFGLTCDPIAARVEAPCMGRNSMAASNAVNSANMAIAGYDHLIPLDQVIAAMDEVGNAMPRELCCTALGGLSITPASKELEAKLDGKPGC